MSSKKSLHVSYKIMTLPYSRFCAYNIIKKKTEKSFSLIFDIFIDLYCIGDSFDLPQCGPPPHWPCGGPCPLLGAVPFQSSVWADEGVGAQKWPTGYFILLPLKIDFILNDKITNVLGFLQLQSV